METLAEPFLELFGAWFSKAVLRVFLGATVFFLPDLLIVICLWTSDSNLWDFASTIASKLLSVAVLLFGMVMDFCMLVALAENNSANHFLGEADWPK